MIRLHLCHETRSMRVLWLLNEMGVPFELVVHPFDVTLKQNDFLTLSPAGRVPVLEIDGQAVFESGAILEFLCEQFPEAGLGRAVGDAERAEWLTWVHYAETISQHCAILNQQHNFIMPPEARSHVVMKVEALRAAKCLAAIERHLEDGRDYLLKGGFSAADIAVGQAVYLAKHFVKLEEFAKLVRWFDRLTARKAYQNALPGPGDTPMFDRDFYPLPEA